MRLGIGRIHRDAQFTSSRDGKGHYLPAGLIVVDVGEVHVGTAHRLNFDVCGHLVGVFEMHWPIEGNIYYVDVTDKYL